MRLRGFLAAPLVVLGRGGSLSVCSGLSGFWLGCVCWRVVWRCAGRGCGVGAGCEVVSCDAACSCVCG